MQSKRVHSELAASAFSANRKRFHLVRLLVLLLIVLTLGLLSSVRADTSSRGRPSVKSSATRPLVLDDLTGFYKPLRFNSGDDIQLADSLSLEEIKISHEKMTHSLVSTITKSSKSSEVGKPFLDPFTQIDGIPEVENNVTLLGCRVITRVATLEEGRLSMKIENSFLLGCGIPVSKTITTQTLQKGEYEGEILFQVLDKNNRPISRYVFKRN